ncbi:hypothetical protein BC939DRAFT_461264 [Gamsiella multidivaricata]|uniref:uncharacterized protein n=1 Tax=Gamsiella multidivaricata TaxID=101098 RepID=UPI0022211397|nr:uncharacterized protein BC939DRAFT_461264 [Gamsiella multidivaricata]KAG0364670.1 hypothetical protein BGZ54_007274 [Gamsiella multidivaricata]KAI7818989.1 hypothetical protein BC939DRAFT_461264 [Gamsiella multidivaricata]
MEDTDMASPPGSFQAAPFSASFQSTESQSASVTPPSASSQPSLARKKSRSLKAVNDGYIYQPYKDYIHADGSALDIDGEPSLSKDDSQASATRILELRGLERRIVQLLETAGQAIQILSGDTDEDENEETGKQLLSNSSLSPEARQAMVRSYADERAKKFETFAAGYATLVNEIQSGLRRQFHYLTKAGISSSQVPFKNVVYGEEKELETWLNAVDVLKESANGLINKVEKDILEPMESSIVPSIVP